MKEARCPSSVPTEGSGWRIRLGRGIGPPGGAKQGLNHVKSCQLGETRQKKWRPELSRKRVSPLHDLFPPTSSHRPARQVPRRSPRDVAKSSQLALFDASSISPRRPRTFARQTAPSPGRAANPTMAPDATGFGPLHDGAPISPQASGRPSDKIHFKPERSSLPERSLSAVCDRKKGRRWADSAGGANANEADRFEAHGRVVVHRA